MEPESPELEKTRTRLSTYQQTIGGNMSKEVEIPEEKIEIINQNIQSLEVEIPEEKIEIINRNIQSLKEKMKTNDGKKKYHYHLQQLKQARKRIFLEVQNALFIKYF